MVPECTAKIFANIQLTVPPLDKKTWTFNSPNYAQNTNKYVKSNKLFVALSADPTSNEDFVKSNSFILDFVGVMIGHQASLRK